MASPNPFGGPNPFADPAVTVHTESAGVESTDDRYSVPPTSTAAWGSNPSAWGSSSASPKNGRKSTTTEIELGKREAEIKQREQQLEQRQRELQKEQRSNAAGTTVRVKNWPRCWPVLYHDIEAEIPVALQTTVKRAYQSYLLFCSTLVFNFLCLSLKLVVDADILGWIFAGIYLLAGVPGAFLLWYGRIYNAASYDRSVTFMFYFFGCAVHIGFCVWAAIAIPVGVGSKKSFAGLFEVFKAFDEASWLGIFYLIAFVLWVANVALSMFVWQKAMRDFRGRGGPQQLQSQAQAAAGRAVLSTATSRV